MRRKFITTNLAPNMIILQSLSRCSYRHIPVDIKELAGETVLDSLNNNGVKGWLRRNGVNVVNETEDGRPHKFSLRDEDTLYLVMDEPGEKNLSNKLASFKDATDLPGFIKPIIIKIVGRSDSDTDLVSVKELKDRLEEKPESEVLNLNWFED